MVTSERVVNELVQCLGRFGSEPIDADTNLYEKGAYYLEDYSELEEWLVAIGEHFGVLLTEEDVCEFVGAPPDADVETWYHVVRPRLTCRHVGEWLWPYIPQVSFESINVAGRECRPAGLFYGMEELASHVDPDAQRFPPSARILDQFQGAALRRFWAQVRFLTHVPLPDLFNVNSAVSQFAMWTFCLLGGTALVCLTFSPEAFVTLLALWFAIIPIMVALSPYSQEETYRSLPQGIVTFRDLAKHLAERMDAPKWIVR